MPSPVPPTKCTDNSKPPTAASRTSVAANKRWKDALPACNPSLPPIEKILSSPSPTYPLPPQQHPLGRLVYLRSAIKRTQLDKSPRQPRGLFSCSARLNAISAEKSEPKP